MYYKFIKVNNLANQIFLLFHPLDCLLHYVGEKNIFFHLKHRESLSVHHMLDQL